jgi:polyisoprenoid-binding protein YceI
MTENHTFNAVTRSSGLVRSTAWSVAVIALLTADLGAHAYKVDKSKVVVVCPLTVGGSFEARATTVAGEMRAAPGNRLEGRLQVDLRSMETGIALRDRHMKENYLEVGKAGFDRAVLERVQLERMTGSTPFTALLTLHGHQRPVVGSATLQETRDGLRVEAEFPVRLSEFAIAEPAYLGVGVTPEVRVRVVLNVSRAETTTE